MNAPKIGKAADPDGISNDWYKDHRDQIVPILLILYGAWCRTGTHPSTFLEANVLFLKKTRSSARSLEFRPLALLNSDYKLYAMVWALRVASLLGFEVCDDQAGFVPGRTIHAVLGAFYSAKRVAMGDHRYRDAIALLLDFAKAYDTASCRFLLWVLERYGLPPGFVRCVAAIHSGTTSRYLVNGFLSSRRPVTSGIRQGCLLASLLFVLLLNQLYRMVLQHPQLLGLATKAGATHKQLSIAGYADDTALYLKNVSEIPVALALLRSFGDMSGLRVNVSKSVGVALHTDSPSAPIAHGFALQDANDTSRYLGIQVASRKWSRRKLDQVPQRHSSADHAHHREDSLLCSEWILLEQSSSATWSRE